MKIYPVGLVGESQYQSEIRNCSEGEPVRICHETGNPHDELALRCETRDGTVIGYIARSSWVRRALHEEGRGCAATIKSIASAGDGLFGVVIDVTLTDDPLLQRPFARRAEQRRPRQKPRETVSDEQIVQTVISASKLPITCDCRAVTAVPILTLTETTSVFCNGCGRSHFLSVDAIEVMEIELLAAVQQMYEDAGRDPPPDETILHLRRNGAAPIHPLPPSKAENPSRLLTNLKRWLFG